MQHNNDPAALIAEDGPLLVASLQAELARAWLWLKPLQHLAINHAAELWRCFRGSRFCP
jgi:hypothetical protein